MDDKDYWNKIQEEDLWVIDKLILAKKLGYLCGPAGVPPPFKNTYVVRPCVNFKMMSRGAYFTELSPTEYNIPDGTFWCEKFIGRHLSFDYHYGQQVLAVEGFRNGRQRLDRFSKWQKVTDSFELPALLKPLSLRYEWLNVEVIGDKVIEVHFRYNDDFANHNSDVIIPVWKDEFYTSECGDRLGFIINPR